MGRMGGSHSGAYRNPLSNSGLVKEHKLAREAIQNSVDARREDGIVQVHFRQQSVDEQRINQIAHHLQLLSPTGPTERGMSVQELGLAPGHFFEAALDADTHPQKILFIEDYQTLGLRRQLERLLTRHTTATTASSSASASTTRPKNPEAAHTDSAKAYTPTPPTPTPSPTTPSSIPATTPPSSTPPPHVIPAQAGIHRAADAPAPFVPDERGANAVSGVCPGRQGGATSVASARGCRALPHLSAHLRHSRAGGNPAAQPAPPCPFRPRRKGRERSERGMPGAAGRQRRPPPPTVLSFPRHEPRMALRQNGQDGRLTQRRIPKLSQQLRTRQRTQTSTPSHPERAPVVLFKSKLYLLSPSRYKVHLYRLSSLGLRLLNDDLLLTFHPHSLRVTRNKLYC